MLRPLGFFLKNDWKIMQFGLNNNNAKTSYANGNISYKSL